ncbi:hypothetical protein PR202_ga04229 [Eleusine coracana subsp. coracana]|uniref:Uncharacterized protein n=1 Tax=Eleusine coracana subsp. coracana TaxID=191504 RepID=A0AAV5BQE3_ELECO|nr:hypothetical protein PR202_ga04229 [Eleusine coracana subsp. coracana]
MSFGSDAEQEQEQKRAAAAAYDYDGDARWADYWSNVLVPPNLASRPDVVDHLKRKFYQRYIVSIPITKASEAIMSLKSTHNLEF